MAFAHVLISPLVNVRNTDELVHSLLGAGRMRLTLALCAVCVVLSPTVSRASPIVIDQQDLSFEGAVNFYFLAQTFTVGLEGNLVGIDVATFTDGPTEVVIYGTTAAGVPDITSVLASESFPILSTATQGALGFQPTIFFSPIAVSPGDVLALAVLVPSPSGGGVSNWNSDFSGGSYAGGAAFRSIGGAPLVGFEPLIVFGSEMDLLFRTYVDTGAAVTPVPEPATLSLLVLGVGVAGARLRARGSRNATRRA
jgi:hypothetical protein